VSADVAEARTWVIDLDGVVWRGDDPVIGSADAIAALRDAQHRVLFATNHSAPTKHQLVEKLRRCGVPCEAQDLMTSADAAAGLVAPGERAYAFAGAGVREALEARRVRLVDHHRADVVVVGWHEDLSLRGLTLAVRAVLAGARLIATNQDRLRPGEDGPVPGAGAFVAAVEAATGVYAQYAGKPNEPMAALISRQIVGSDVVVVGDSSATDGGLAVALQARFVLVRTGNAVEGVEHGALVADDLLAVVTDALSKP